MTPIIDLMVYRNIKVMGFLTCSYSVKVIYHNSNERCQYKTPKIWERVEEHVSERGKHTWKL